MAVAEAALAIIHCVGAGARALRCPGSRPPARFRGRGRGKQREVPRLSRADCSAPGILALSGPGVVEADLFLDDVIHSRRTLPRPERDHG